MALTLPAGGRLDILVDTSGWVAAAHVRETEHVRARAMFRAAATRNRSLCTTNFLVGETHALLLARYGRVSALSFLRSVENGTTTIERISSDDERRAIAIIEQNDDKDFSYVDATSFAAMERLAIEEALTFDRHFIQFGFRQASA